MNLPQYNQALNKAMPWTAKLEEISGDELETLEQKLERLADTDCIDLEHEYIDLGEHGTATIPLEVKPSKESKIL